MGTRNAAVLPVPVSAQAITSDPASASGMTPLCTGRVSSHPRSRMPPSSRSSRCRRSNVIGAGSNADGSYASVRGSAGWGDGRSLLRREGPRRRRGCREEAAWVLKEVSASSERDDAAHRVVGGDSNGHAVARDHLDAEAAHAAAQLRQHFVAGIALHPVQPAGMHGDNGALHIYQIVFAQSAHPFTRLAISVPQLTLRRNPCVFRELAECRKGARGNDLTGWGGDDRIVPAQGSTGGRRGREPPLPPAPPARRNRRRAGAEVPRTSPARGPPARTSTQPASGGPRRRA